MNYAGTGYGLILEQPVPNKDFVFGGYGTLDGQVQVADGDWTYWLPEPELQDANKFEPNCCVSEALLNVVETAERKEYGLSANYSDRFLATASGTNPKQGNSMNTVTETLRKKGCVLETEWPFKATTLEEFYSHLPQRLYTLALRFTAAYNFGHEYVPPNAESLMEALKYSPLLFSTYAWTSNNFGIYYRPAGFSDNHAVTCYGYQKGEYWKIFDSYIKGTTVLKKVAWDSLPMQCKRITLNRQVVSESAFIKFVNLLRLLFTL